MRVLIDTNIFIEREGDSVVTANLQRLLALMHEYGVTVLVHPDSVNDLMHDSNKQRRSIMLSKLKSYPFLERTVEWKNDNAF